MASPLTDTFGGLKGWQWVVIVGGAGGATLYLLKRRSGSSAAAGAPPDQLSEQDLTDPYGPLPGNGQIVPIIIQQGSSSTAKPAPLNLNDYVRRPITKATRTLPFAVPKGAYWLDPKGGLHQFKEARPQGYKLQNPIPAGSIVLFPRVKTSA